MPSQPYKNPITGKPFAPRLNVPEVFGTAMSYEDQIHMLLAYVNNILETSDFATKSDVASSVASAIASAQKLVDALRGETIDRTAYLQRQIDEMAAGYDIYGIYLGAYGPNQDVMRGTGNFLAVHALTCAQLGAMEITCAELRDSGINVHGLAVLGLWLIGKGYTLPDRFVPRREPQPGITRDLVTDDLPNMAVNEQMFVVLKE